jgi:uncharacterized protein (TIGR04222 family)
MGLGPFDLAGGPFLQLYGTLFVFTFIAGVAIPRCLRPEGRSIGGVGEADRLAYLAGGATRFGEALVARLLAIGAIVVENRRKLQIRALIGVGQSSAERSVLALPSPASWGHVTRAIRQDADAIEHELVSLGLLIDRSTGWQMRLWQTTPYLLLLLFGALKWEIGTIRDRPVGYLTALLAATAICALVRFAALDRRTRAGVAALKDARLQSSRLRRAPVAEETGLAVALYGTVVLAGSPWSDFHWLRSSGGDAGSSSGGSHGGCGGGGCGGCGG